MKTTNPRLERGEGFDSSSGRACAAAAALSLLLMTILAETLFPLMGRHFVALPFLAARHIPGLLRRLVDSFENNGPQI